MKRFLVAAGLVGVGGFGFGLAYSLSGDAKAMIVGMLVMGAGMIGMGVIFLLCWGVYTRNMGSKQQSRQQEFGYPQSPMLIMTGPEQLPQQQGYTSRQMPMLDLKADSSKKEYVEW